jgi:hypothetical protein
MLKRLLQAAMLTFLLNLVVSMNSSATSLSVLPSSPTLDNQATVRPQSLLFRLITTMSD